MGDPVSFASESGYTQREHLTPDAPDPPIFGSSFVWRILLFSRGNPFSPALVLSRSCRFHLFPRVSFYRLRYLLQTDGWDFSLGVFEMLPSDDWGFFPGFP